MINQITTQSTVQTTAQTTIQPVFTSTSNAPQPTTYTAITAESFISAFTSESGTSTESSTAQTSISTYKTTSIAPLLTSQIPNVPSDSTTSPPVKVNTLKDLLR